MYLQNHLTLNLVMIYRQERLVYYDTRTYNGCFLLFFCGHISIDKPCVSADGHV